MAENISTYHLADNPQLYEPARTNNFDLLCFGIDSLLKPGVAEELADEGSYITNGQTVLKCSLISSTIPHFKMSEIEVKRGNTIEYFAGTPTWEPLTLKFNDFIGAKTKQVLLAIQRGSFDVNTGAVKNQDEYKHEWKLIQYAPDGLTVIGSWRIIGGWITGLDEDEFNNENNQKKTITATLRYDRAIPQDEE